MEKFVCDVRNMRKRKSTYYHLFSFPCCPELAYTLFFTVCPTNIDQFILSFLYIQGFVRKRLHSSEIFMFLSQCFDIIF